MDNKYSFSHCTIHDTYPNADEPCWKCVNNATRPLVADNAKLKKGIIDDNEVTVVLVPKVYFNGLEAEIARLRDALERIKAVAEAMEKKCYEGTGIARMKSRAIAIQCCVDKALAKIK